MKFDCLIKNGRIVRERVTEGTVAVKDGKIAEIITDGHLPEAEKVIDAEGNYVFPGAIDTHAHLNEPGYEWREDYAHGTRGAALGGYTTILDMPLQNEPALTTARLFDRKKEKVSSGAYVDFCFWGGLVPGNFGELEALWERGCIGFKSFIGPVSPDYRSLSYGQVYEAMKIIGGFGGKAGFHCEDYSIIKRQEERMKHEGRLDWQAFLDSRPVSAETVATAAVIEMAKETGCRAHICHVSSPGAAHMVQEAREAGFDVTAETCAHYLSMTEEDVRNRGALFKCAPPLRSPKERDELWSYVEKGVFSGIASDHSPCTYEEKFEEILGKKIETVFDVWGGISGIQSCFQTAFYEGCVKRGLPPETLSRAMALLPAKAFGLYGRKGALEKGFDADLVILDPEKTWEIREDSLEYVNKISAFAGKRGTGLPVLTMVRGQVVAENQRITGKAGYGRLVERR